MGPLPPSAKLVYKVLENDGQLTRKDLVERTSLPSRTVLYAVRRLKEKNVLIERFYFMDARQSLYSVPEAGGGRSPGLSDSMLLGHFLLFNLAESETVAAPWHRPCVAGEYPMSSPP